MSYTRRRLEKVVDHSEKSNHSNSNIDDNDISFMDTEPLDVSALNTEPMELDDSDEEGEPAGTEDETSDSDTEIRSEKHGSNNKDANENESDQCDVSDNEFNDCESNLDTQEQSDNEFLDDISHFCDDSSSGSQPPAVDISMASSHGVKRIYSDLIDSCRGFEDDSFRDGSNKRVLKDNIKTGQALFQQLETTLSNTFNETNTEAGERPILGNSVLELYLAAQHTKHCGKMLRHAVNNAINVETPFKVDEFLDNLRNSCLDKEGGYSVLSCVRKLAFTASSVGYSVSHFKTVMGCMDMDAFRSQDGQAPDALSTTKIRQRRKKDEVKDEDTTQKEIVNVKTELIDHKEIKIKNDTPDGLASDILRSVKSECKDQEASVNVLKVAYAENLPDVISRLFGVAFLVRDGFVSLNVPDNVDAAPSCTSLTLKPDKPPKTETKGDRKQRSQHIASFPVTLLRGLADLEKNANGK